MTRTMPIELALDEVMVAYGQNGEMLRPENGYPLRLVVPGVQGVSLGQVAAPHRGRATSRRARKDEALHYIDLMPDGLHRQYTCDPGVQERDHHALGRPGAAGQGLLQRSPAWRGRAAARSSGSTCRSTAGATGARRGWRSRC